MMRRVGALLLAACTVLACSCGLFGPGEPAPAPPKPAPAPAPAPPPGEPIDAKALATALEELAPPAPAGIKAARLLYSRGRDRVAADCDVELADGRPIAIVVRDALPAPVVPFASADRVGNAWVVAGAAADRSSEWPVDATADLDRTGELLAWLPRPRELARRTVEGAPRSVREAGILWTRVGDLDVGLEGERPSIVAVRPTGGALPARAPGGTAFDAQTVRVTKDAMSLTLRVGTGVIVLGGLAGGDRELARVEVDAAAPAGTRFALERIAPVDRPLPAAGDELRAAIDAHRLALERREGVALAATAMVRAFGPWVGATLIEPVRAEADERLRAGDLAGALDPLLEIARGLDAAALVAQADAACAQGYALEALARTLAAQGDPPRADLAWTAARRTLAVSAQAPAAARRTLRGRAVELLALASGHQPDRARALALARGLLEAGEAELVGDVGSRIGPWPDLDLATREALPARRAELYGRIVDDLRAHRADLGREVLDALDLAIRVRPERAVDRLLAARPGPVAPLQSQLREILSWTLPDRGGDALVELASALGAALAAAAPPVELDRAETSALAAQLGTEVPELFEAVLARHLPSLSAEARARARRDLASRLAAEAANPLFPWRKWPVPGLSLRLRARIEADAAALASAAGLDRALRRSWAELESASSPWLLARSDDDRASLARYLALAGGTP